MAEIPFPLAFHSGQSKQNTPFEFYSVPKIKGDEAVLIHFMEEDRARDYFESIRPAWEGFLRSHRKKQIDSIFKEKGWKVK